MKKMNNKSGFTLIEIIVVLIIVGILAAIALPNLFSNVTKSRAAEALATLASYKSQMEGCLQGHTSTANTTCAAGGTGGIPANGQISNFDYAVTAPAADTTATTWTVVATYAAKSADTVTMTRNTDGSITCTGASDFVGVC